MSTRVDVDVGMSTAELSAVTGIPYGVIANRVHRHDTPWVPSIVTGHGSRHRWSHADAVALWAMRTLGLVGSGRGSGGGHAATRDRQRRAVWAAVHTTPGRFLVVHDTTVVIVDDIPALASLPPRGVTTIVDLDTAPI